MEVLGQRPDAYRADSATTATRSDAPILDIPASIQVVPREVLEDQRATETMDALRNVSGVQNAGTFGNRSRGVNLRGFQSFRFAKDGFFSPASFGDVGFLDMANVERIEVLKGPASVLFGQNEPGGLVNIVTKKPQAQALRRIELNSGFVKGADDDVNELRGHLDINQPFSETVFARFNAAYQEGDSFRNFFIDSDRTLLAPAVRWQPTERTKVDLQLDYFDQRQQFDRGLVAVDGNPRALPRDRFLGERFSQFEAEEMLVQATLEHRFSKALRLRSRARYSDSDADRFSADPRGLQDDGRTLNRRVADLDQRIDNYGLQNDLIVELDTGWASHEIVAGVDLNATRFDSGFRTASLDPIDIFEPQFGAQPGEFGPVSTQDRRIDFLGLYLQDRIGLGTRWSLLLSARFDFADTRFKRDGATVTDTEDREFSPRAGLVFHATPTLRLYTSYTESFSPFVFAAPEGGGSFNPETGEQVELGAKKAWLGGRLSTTVALYNLKKQNVLTDDPENPDRSIQTGEQRSRGVEIDIAGELLPNWQLIASAAFTNAEVTEDNVIAVGNALEDAARWSGSLWSTYTLAGGPLPGARIGGGVFYVGDRAGDLVNSFEVDSYTRVDLFSRLPVPGLPALTVALNIENVFDRKYIAAASGASSVEPGQPRSVFLRLAYAL